MKKLNVWGLPKNMDKIFGMGKENMVMGVINIFQEDGEKWQKK